MSDWTTVSFPVLDVAYNTDELTASASLTTNYQVVLADATAYSITLTLPPASTHTGWMYIIKKTDATDHTVTIDGYSSEKIDGETKVVLSKQYSFVSIVCDGTEWLIIGGEFVKMEQVWEDMLEEERDTVKLLQRQILLLGVIERHISDEREEEVDKDEVQEQLDDEFSDNIDDEVE